MASYLSALLRRVKLKLEKPLTPLRVYSSLRFENDFEKFFLFKYENLEKVWYEQILILKKGKEVKTSE